MLTTAFCTSSCSPLLVRSIQYLSKRDNDTRTQRRKPYSSLIILQDNRTILIRKDWSRRKLFHKNRCCKVFTKKTREIEQELAESFIQKWCDRWNQNLKFHFINNRNVFILLQNLAFNRRDRFDVPSLTLVNQNRETKRRVL